VYSVLVAGGEERLVTAMWGPRSTASWTSRYISSAPGCSRMPAHSDAWLSLGLQRVSDARKGSAFWPQCVPIGDITSWVPQVREKGSKKNRSNRPCAVDVSQLR